MKLFDSEWKVMEVLWQKMTARQRKFLCVWRILSAGTRTRRTQ